MIENIFSAAAAAGLSEKKCNCVARWNNFKADPSSVDYLGKYGNHHGKPGHSGAVRDDLESEFQQGGRFNDVNEIGTSKGVKGKAGEIAKMATMSPPGFGGTVKHMQENHPEISNPYALAYWMKDQGYSSHFTESGKKK